MEQVLDDIAGGETKGIPYLKSFYLGERGLDCQVKAKEQEIDPRSINALVLDDVKARVRIGRYGAYLEQDDNGESIRVSLPDNMPPGDLASDEVQRLLREKKTGPTPLGHDPKTGEPVFVLKGPYGPYIQLGPNGENGTPKKPPRVSLPKNMQPGDVTLDQALALLRLPRVLGKHPETGLDVEAGIGRFGPYVRHNSTYCSLTGQDNVLTVDLNRALELLAQKKAKRSRTEMLRELGAHPDDGDPVALYEGRYGPYVKHGKTNASLSKGMSPETITLQQAVELLAQKKTRKTSKRKSKKKAK
jgi:DNA topoisomerase-1